MSGGDIGGKVDKRALYDPSSWVVPYADLITTLMIFFLLLYSVSAMGGLESEKLLSNVQSAMGGKVDEDASQKSKESDAANKLSSELQDTARIEINSQRIKISLPAPVLYNSGEAALKPEAAKSLSGIAKIIKDMPNNIVVEGYTDNIPVRAGVGKYDSNWELSAARAFSVIKYLMDEEKIDSKRFTVYGYGEFHPLESNDTEEGRAKNRRIEISILRSQGKSDKKDEKKN
ncbi:MAG: hypothetical protein A2252_01260 [Elusimicrobia bacterium RIFOXYA2_FULL_39_19]|nr:MAG: hypothetical protein A2252_01260 [Elusimicrobia bacterium RIFOXYA2_FULL_39_19]